MTIKKLYILLFLTNGFFSISFAQTIDFNELKQCYASLRVPTPDPQILSTILTSHFLNSDIVSNASVEPNALIIQRPNLNNKNQLDVYVVQEGQAPSFPLNLFKTKDAYTAQRYQIPRSSVTNSKCNRAQSVVQLPIEGQCPNRSTCPRFSMQLSSENKTVHGQSVSSPCPPKLVSDSANIKPSGSLALNEIESLVKQALIDNLQALYENFDVIIEQLKKDSPPNSPEAYVTSFKNQALKSLKSSDPRGSCHKIFPENDGVYQLSQKILCEKLNSQSTECHKSNLQTPVPSAAESKSNN